MLQQNQERGWSGIGALSNNGNVMKLLLSLGLVSFGSREPKPVAGTRSISEGIMKMTVKPYSNKMFRSMVLEEREKCGRRDLL
jgi:hypothetical protein